jgi:hypothetical protein
LPTKTIDQSDPSKRCKRVFRLLLKFSWAWLAKKRVKANPRQGLKDLFHKQSQRFKTKRERESGEWKRVLVLRGIATQAICHDEVSSKPTKCQKRWRQTFFDRGTRATYKNK